MNEQKGLIYCYTYLPTSEKYIGYTINFKKRQREHLDEFRTNLKFHNLLRKHYNDFQIDILEDNIPLELLEEKEKYYIAKYNTFLGEGFNLTEGGDGSFTYCQQYWKTHPEELKQHIAKIQPLAAKASKEFWKNNPEWKENKIKQLQQQAKEWRENHPEEFKHNYTKAQEKAKEWRINNPEKVQESIKKAIAKASKKVLLVNTNEIFPSTSEAGRVYNVCSSSISACCRGERKSAGKDKNKNKLIWKYI